jgi:hypothetical protein
MRNGYDEPATVGDGTIDSAPSEAGLYVIWAEGLNHSVRPLFFRQAKLASESLQGDPRRSKSPLPSWTHPHRPCRFPRRKEMLLNVGNGFDIEEYQSKTGRLQWFDLRPSGRIVSKRKSRNEVQAYFIQRQRDSLSGQE